MVAYLPAVGMPLSIEESNIGIANHAVSLNKASVHLGNSAIHLTGSISNLFPPKGNDSPLEGLLTVRSAFIDANQLMNTAGNSGAIMQSLDELDAFAGVDSTGPVVSEKAVFKLPEGIHFLLNLSVDKLQFGQQQLEQIAGTARLEKGQLILPDVSFRSQNATVQSSLRYQPQTAKHARLFYTLKIEDLEMNHIKDLAPSLDTLFPLAKSLNGVANLQIRGVAMLNEHMEPEMKSVRSIAVLAAHNLSVGKSEAFRELAKTFMFKNKDSTKIDSLNVEMMIGDNHLEILPALVEVDRYSLAVGGTQNLDLSFNYHISVLKSQIPFKTGVDIEGTMPTYKIKLSKAKYKYYFTDKSRPQEKADTTILNKKKLIEEKLKF